MGDLFEGESWSFSSESSISSFPVSRNISTGKIHRSSFSISTTGKYTFSVRKTSGADDYYCWISSSSSNYNLNGSNPPSGYLVKSSSDDIVDGKEVSLTGGTSYYLYYSHTSADFSTATTISINLTFNSSSGDDPIFENPWSIVDKGSVSSWPISNLSISAKKIYKYSFTTDADGIYTFTASSSGDTYGWLANSSSAYDLSQEKIYNVPRNYMQKDNDSNGTNFQLSATLEKNKTYYLYFALYSLTASSTNISITLGIDQNEGYPPLLPSDHPYNNPNPPTEPEYNWSYTKYSSDGIATTSSNIDTNDSFISTDDNSNIKINITLINSLIDGWNFICQKRQYYGNLSSLANNITKLTSKTLAKNTSLNALIDTYNKYFIPHSTITIVNQGEQINKNKLSLLVDEFANQNRNCKQACTGYCTTTNSHSINSETCRGYCSGGCLSGCFGCTGNCAGSCNGCTGECKTICVDSCQGHCGDGYCGSECTGTSEGIYGKSGTGSGGCSGCASRCTSGCGQNCVGGCANDCYDKCHTSCNIWCNTQCSNDCYQRCDTECAYQATKGAVYFRQTEAWSYGGYTMSRSGWYYCSDCDSICGTSCGGGCLDSCTNSCQGSCDGYCGDDCANSCNETCEGTCLETCTNNCAENSSGTTTTCSNNCTGACGSNCTGKCNSECEGDCEGICQLYCDNVCSTGCYTGCNDGCYNQTKFRANNGCRSSCYGYCQEGCNTGCQNSSGGGTSSVSGCGDSSCATSCSSYCVIASS